MPSNSISGGFFRSGGFDQVRIETAGDFRNLHSLDQKLWAALSCPVRGLEFNLRTLSCSTPTATKKSGSVRCFPLLSGHVPY